MRCYNGCPDSQLQAYLDEKERVHKELAKLGVRATYFPVEQRWMGFKNYVPVTGFTSLHGVLQEAAACRTKEVA